MPDNKTVREALHFSRDVYSEGWWEFRQGGGNNEKRGGKKALQQRGSNSTFSPPPPSPNPLKKNLPLQPFVDKTQHEYEYSHVRNKLRILGEKETISITINARLSVRLYYGDSKETNFHEIKYLRF